jgi:predicted ATP-dependent serine protease
VLRSPLPQSLRLSTGIAGLDNIMGGGLMPGRLYLVEGTPGAGKTTLGLRMVSPSSTSQGCNSVTSRLGLDRFSADVSSKKSMPSDPA